MIRSVWSRGSLLGALCTLTVLAGSDSAQAASALCGQVVTQSIVLTEDQTCTGTALIVGADGVTIDLGGFTLTGDSNGIDEYGIDIAGHSDVVIRNGTITGFFDGITSDSFDTPQRIAIAGVVSRDNVRKGASLFVDGLTITGCSFISNGTDGTSGSSGLEVGGVGAKITASAFVANTGDGFLYLAGTQLTAANLVAALNGDDGINLSNGKRVTLQASTSARNRGNGISVFGFGTTQVKIAKSTMVGNGSHGIELGTIFGDPARPNLFTKNLVGGNRASGVKIHEYAAYNTLAGNRLIGNGGDGVVIDTNGVALVLKGNTAEGNRSDGFDVASEETTFTKNVALANRARGIWAPNGAADGGGNTARGNGADAQCSTSPACPPRFISKPKGEAPECNTAITASITLGSDTPVCAETDGFLVDADGVTIDLNGHEIVGDGTPGTIGIFASGRSNVTIKNGVIRGFARGIVAEDTLGLKLVNVEVRDNAYRGATLSGADIAINKSTFASNAGAGVEIGTAVGPVSTGVSIANSFFVGNDEGIVSHAIDTRLARVMANANGAAGIVLDAQGSGAVSGSTMAGNLNDGIRIDGNFAPVAVTRSTIIGNEWDGIVLTSAGGPVTVGSNAIAGNGFRGLAVMGAPTQAVLTKNAAIGNQFAGIYVDSDVLATTVVGNDARANDGHGLVVATYAGSVVKNRADANLLFGITVPNGATDGGGNTAHANAGAAECGPGVACQ